MSDDLRVVLEAAREYLELRQSANRAGNLDHNEVAEMANLTVAIIEVHKLLAIMER